MMGKRLTRNEIDAALRKLERKYDEYIVECGRTRAVKDAFRDRYRDALARKLDISAFILAEMEALEERLRTERRRISELRERASDRRRAASGRAASGGGRRDFADRVLEEYAERIAGYPLFPGLGNDLSEDVSRLYGAIGEFERTRWPAADHLLRRSFPSGIGWTRNDLENALIALCSSTPHGLPLPLERYERALRLRNSSTPDPDRMRKQAILEAAFFLHRLQATLDAVMRQADPGRNGTSAETAEASAILKEIGSVIADFRLSDLRPSGLPDA